jgi:hypothetical protein
MPARLVPRRHWRSYGDHPLPTGKEALDEPFRAFPSWFLRIACERCGKVQMVNEVHMKRGATSAVTASGAVKWPWGRPGGRSVCPITRRMLPNR